MRHLVTAIVLIGAGIAGLWLVTVDARTDDTGIEAGIIFVIAAGLAAVRPRAAIVIAFLVGGLIPIAEAFRSGTFPGGIGAVPFAVAGALVGAYVGIVLRRTVQPST